MVAVVYTFVRTLSVDSRPILLFKSRGIELKCNCRSRPEKVGNNKMMWLGKAVKVLGVISVKCCEREGFIFSRAEQVGRLEGQQPENRFVTTYEVSFNSNETKDR